MGAVPVAVQLYTVRNEVAEDFVGTLKAVAKVGYDGVQFAAGGFGGLGAREVRSVLNDLGLGVAGSHVGLPDLETRLEQVIEFQVELGSRHVVCPWVPEERRRSADDWRRLAEILTGIGRRCREAGLALSYHNHDFELQQFEGRYGLDILFDSAPGDLVLAEPDVYWLAFAGVDPVAYVRKLGARAPLLHFKDMAREDRFFAEVGEGTLDFPAIFEATKDTAAWYIVEQDHCRRPPLESIRISIENLRAMGIA